MLKIMQYANGCPCRLMRHLFTILAVRDIAKSEFAESEELSVAKMAQGGRSLALDENTDEPTQTTHRGNFGASTRCLKFILSPNSESPSPELITAFEFKGHIGMPPIQNTVGFSWLEGCQLEISSPCLEFNRKVLLLDGSQCKVVANRTGSRIASSEFSEFSFCDDDDIDALLQDQDVTIL